MKTPMQELIEQFNEETTRAEQRGDFEIMRLLQVAKSLAEMKLNREKALEELGSVPEGFNFAVNAMMAIGLFRSQGIDLPSKNNTELSVKERNDLFNQGTFYLSCGMTIAQYEKMVKTNKVMFTRDVFFSNFEGN